MNKQQNNNNPNSSKRQSIRYDIRQLRQQLSTQQQQQNASKLANQLLQLQEIKKADNIALYLNNDAEIDLQPIIDYLWLNNKNCYLPVLSKTNKGYLLFLQYAKQQPLVKNCFNIFEPVYDVKLCQSAQQMDIILIPLVAFDPDCNRIGMGGGYYDRSLSFINSNSTKPLLTKPLLIGVAHSIQCVEQIPTESWDIKLDKIVTEEKIFIPQQ